MLMVKKIYCQIVALILQVTFATMGPSVTWPAMTLESFRVDVTHLQACSAVQAFLSATTAIVTIPAFQTWLQKKKQKRNKGKQN